MGALVDTQPLDLDQFSEIQACQPAIDLCARNLLTDRVWRSREYVTIGNEHKE